MMRPWSHTEGRGILVGTAGPREVRFRTRRLPFNGAGDMEAGFLAFAEYGMCNRILIQTQFFNNAFRSFWLLYI